MLPPMHTVMTIHALQEARNQEFSHEATKCYRKFTASE